MRRLAILGLVVAAVLIGMIAGGPGFGTIAQDGTPTAMARHPVVGAWTGDNDINDPETPRLS